MDRVLVSGGSGFIGRAVVTRLRELGFAVTSVGRGQVSTSDVDRAQIGVGEAPWSRDVWLSVLEQVRPTMVMHLAGMMQGSEEQIFAANLGSAEGLFGAIEALGGPFPRVLVAGSATEYGAAILDGVPVSEDVLCAPESAYGRSKLAQTEALLEFGQRTSVPVVSARIFNPIGIGMPGHLALANFARQIQAMPGRGSLKVGNLDVWRDQIDVGEAARILVELSVNPGIEGVYNVCSGVAYHLREAVERMIARSGKAVDLVVDASRMRSNDRRVIVGSVERLKSVGIVPLAPDVGAIVDELIAANAGDAAA